MQKNAWLQERSSGTPPCKFFHMFTLLILSNHKVLKGALDHTLRAYRVDLVFKIDRWSSVGFLLDHGLMSG